VKLQIVGVKLKYMYVHIFCTGVHIGAHYMSRDIAHVQ